MINQKDQLQIAQITQMLSNSSRLKPEDQFLNMFDIYLKSGAITYYVIRNEKGQVFYASSENALAKETNFNLNSKFQSRNNIEIANTKYTVTFGKDEVSSLVLLLRVLNEQKEILLILIFGIVLLIIRVAVYYLNFDSVALLNWLKKGTANGEGLTILSAAAKKLERYVTSVEKSGARAKAQAIAYKENAYSGLSWAHEKLELGVKSLNFAVGRCDINNYSVLLQIASPELVDFVKKSFFNQGAELLTRYGALKESSAGDDIVFFVPAGEVENPELSALHIMRGFFEIAERLNSEITIPNFKVTLKGSIDYGEVELAKLGGNAETEGLPFVFTERILRTIKNKEQSTLAILSASINSYKKYISNYTESRACKKF